MPGILSEKAKCQIALTVQCKVDYNSCTYA